MRGLVAPVGGVLLVARLAERADAPCYVVVAMGVGVGLLEYARKFCRGAAVGGKGRGRWGRLLTGMCALLLSLTEAVRSMMVERETSPHGEIAISGRLSCAVVLLACVACGSATVSNFNAKYGVIVGVVLNLAAAAGVLAWSTGPRLAAGGSDYALLALGVDYMLAHDAHWAMQVACVVAATVATAGPSPWAFAALVFPGMCAWQRRVFWGYVVGDGMKPAAVLYCLACLGALALCCAVYEPLAWAVLVLHFVLRYAAVVLLRPITRIWHYIWNNIPERS